MEQKLNIKDKPAELKLYSSTFGYIKFNGVHKDKIYFSSEDTNMHSVKPNGKMYDSGECIIFPSKKMRDWSKFSWKKGDILVSRDKNIHLIFEKFIDDTYTIFAGKHCYEKDYRNEYNYERKFDGFKTEYFTLETGDAAQKYLKTIEEKLDGKLNRETLEVEKPQPEFKDGDIVFMKGIKSELFANCIFILRSEYKDGDERAFYYAFYNADDKYTLDEYGNTKVHYSLRLATDSEKQQLFDALSKKGKRWDAEKKEIVDLKPKVELKPFDKVLSRRCSEDYWVLNFYLHKTDYYHVCIDGSSNLDCIPYNEETAHLLGTTDEWKGGEQ